MLDLGLVLKFGRGEREKERERERERERETKEISHSTTRPFISLSFTAGEPLLRVHSFTLLSFSCSAEEREGREGRGGEAIVTQR